MDDPDLLRIITDILTLEGWKPVPASSGETAIEALQSGVFDLMLLDLNLPDMTGWRVLEAAREVDPSMPVVILTAIETNATRQQATAAGVKDYLTKPVSAHDLMAVLRRNLGES